MAMLAGAMVPLAPTGSFNSGDVSKKTFVQVVSRVASSIFQVANEILVEANGEQGFVFSESELSKAVEDFCFAPTLKFSHSWPSIDVICMTMIKTWGLQDIPNDQFYG